MDQHKPVYGHGKICYLEIPAVDPGVSADFYQKIFHWEIRRDDDGNVAFDDTVGMVSGMWVTGRKPLSDPGIIISIMVDNAAETVELIRQSGGTITGDRAGFSRDHRAF